MSSTKIALFSTEDVPRGERHPWLAMFGIPAAIKVNGEVMEFTVLEHREYVTNATDGVTGLIEEINQIGRAE